MALQQALDTPALWNLSVLGGRGRWGGRHVGGCQNKNVLIRGIQSCARGVMMGDSNKGSLPLASPTSLIMDSGLLPMSSLDPCSAPSCLSHLAPSSCSPPHTHQPVFLSGLAVSQNPACAWVHANVDVCMQIMCNECVCGQVWMCACVSVYMYADMYSECAYVCVHG